MLIALCSKLYPVPVTGTGSPRIVHRQSAINNSLVPVTGTRYTTN